MVQAHGGRRWRKPASRAAVLTGDYHGTPRFWNKGSLKPGSAAPSPRPPRLAHPIGPAGALPLLAGTRHTYLPFAGSSTAVAVKIKLKRMGAIREPYYRIVVADARTKRDGRAIEEIGKYHPKQDPSVIEVNSERAQYWLSVGAQPTDPGRRRLEVTGDWQKFKGLPGAEGTLKVAEPKADKKERYESLVKESLVVKEEAKAAAKSAKAAKKDAAKKEAAEPKAEAPAEAAPAATEAKDEPAAAEPKGEAAAEAATD